MASLPSRTCELCYPACYVRLYFSRAVPLLVASARCAYLGGSAIQTVGDNPVTAYRQLVQQYAKGVSGEVLSPAEASAEANKVRQSLLTRYTGHNHAFPRLLAPPPPGVSQSADHRLPLGSVAPTGWCALQAGAQVRYPSWLLIHQRGRG